MNNTQERELRLEHCLKLVNSGVQNAESIAEVIGAKKCTTMQYLNLLWKRGEIESKMHHGCGTRFRTYHPIGYLEPTTPAPKPKRFQIRGVSVFPPPWNDEAKPKREAGRQAPRDHRIVGYFGRVV